MANDKKFIVKNGLLTEEDVIIGSTTDTGQRLQITGSSKFSGTIDASQATLATATATFTNTGGTGGAVIAKFVGDSDALQILNVGTGDYKITNAGQDNGVVFYDNTDGVEIIYNGSVDLDFNSTGIDFKREPTYDGNVFWNAGNDGAGSGLDADLIDGLDSLQFVRSDEDDTMDGTYTVTGDFTISGNLTVSGTTTTVNTETVLIADNILTLNSDYTVGAPTENSGFEIRRGNEANSSFIWDETNDYFKLISAGTDLGRIITTADEGSGNGFDADTVDGLEAYQFLRSDVADTANGHITFDDDITVGDGVGDARINFAVGGQDRVLYADDGTIGFLNPGLNYAARSDEFDNWIVGANTVSDKFVDSADASYYGQFSQTSTMNNIDLEGSIRHKGDTDTFLTFDAADTLSITTGGTERFTFNNTFAESVQDLRAPRFVDSNNNSYYANPASSSVFNTLGIDTDLFHNGDTDTFIRFTNNRIGFQTGGAERFAIDNDSADFTVGVYAPIYYDSNDNTFYVDPASDSRMYGILLDNRITSDGDTNTYIDFNAADTFRVITGGSARLTVTNSAVTGSVDFVAPRFVDSNNNSYFANPAADSVFHALGIDDDLYHNGDTNTKLAFATDNISLQTGGSERIDIQNTRIDLRVNPYASRYYDSDNESYYADPAGDSQFNTVDIDDYIRHRGDTNTYIGFNASDQFVVYTGGSEAVRVDSNQDTLFKGIVKIDTDPAATFGISEALRIDDGAGTNDRQLQFFEFQNSGARSHRLSFNTNTTTTGSAYTYTQGNWGGSSTIEFANDGSLKIYSNNQVTGGSPTSITPNEVVSFDWNSVDFSQNVYAPSIYIDDYIIHDGDTNTYIGFDTNDRFGIWTAGTRRFYIDATDADFATNVGIHKTTPTAALSVQVSGTLTANPFAAGHTFADFGDGGTVDMAIRGTSNRDVWFTNEGNASFYFSDSGATVALGVLNGGNVTVNTDAVTYANGDFTPLVGSKTNSKLHVNGGIQLNGNNDAIVFGRGTSSFLKDEELGFGWGGGWYMTDGTYLRVRNNKTVYSTGEAWFDIFKDSDDQSFYMDFTAGGKLKGNFEVAATSTGTSYSTAAIELRESNYTANATATPPHLGFHWGGVVASQISVESSGRIVIRNNPGTGYEDFGADEIFGNKFTDISNNAYYFDPQGVTGGWRLKTPSGRIDFGPMNTGYAHIQTDRSQFYFNKKLVVDEGIVQSYNEDLWLRRTTSTSARIRILNGTTYSDQDFYIRGGTAVSDPSKLIIESTTQENTQPGEMYAQMQFKVGGTPGGLTASGITGTDVNTIAMITAEDFRNGDTSNEDSGLGFYTSVSGGSLRYNGGISSTGTWYVGNLRGTGTRGDIVIERYAYAQRYYDRNDGNYYLDPNGTSQLNRIDINDYIRHRGDTDTYFGFEANNTFRVWTGGTRRLNIDNNSADFAVNVYAPVYYDSNDPTYYANPAGTSLFQRLTLPQNTVGQAHAGVATQPDYYIGQQRGDNDAWKIYGESPGGTNTGDLIIQSEDDFDGNESIRLRFKRTYGAYDTRDNLIVKFNYVESPTEFRAPLFRDTNNTSYYADPAGDSQFNTVDIDDYIRHRGDTNTYFGFEANDTIRFWTNSTRRLNIDNNSADFSVNVYAPRYYDSNDDFYYTDPATFSRMNGITFGNPGNGTNTKGRWISIEGNTDGSGEGSGRIFFSEHNSTNTSKSNYGMSLAYRGGATSIAGADGNTWTGLSSIPNGYWALYGHNNNAAGAWALRGFRDAQTVEVNNRIDAQRFRDRNDTNYYVDPASTSITNIMRANRYQIDGSEYYIDSPSGGYGSIRVEGDKSGSWAGYAIRDDWVFMADGPSNAGIYNDTDDEWAVLARRNAEVELFYNGQWELETGPSRVDTRVEHRAPKFTDLNSTSYYADFDAGNTGTALNIRGVYNRTGFANDSGVNNRIMVGQDRNHWIWNTATDWGIFWATTGSPAYSHFSSGNANELVFVGNGNVRASLDLDNGNFYIGGTFSASNLALNGGNEDISLNKAYTRGLADETLFDGTSYWEKRVIKNMQGSENYATGSTGEYVKSSDVPGSSSYVIQTASYRTFYSDYIEVEPGEEVYGEMWVKLISGSTDASNGGRFYYGIERFDKDKRPIAGNTGTTYFVSGGSRPNSTSWQKFSGYTTIPSSHTPYGGSDGGGVRYVRIRILMNYSGGTSKTRQFSAPILKRVNTNHRLRVDNSLYVGGRIDSTEYVDAYRFRDRDNNNYYVEPASTSVMATIDANVFRARGDTTYFLDPNADHSMRVYGEISNSNYANGNMQPGTLNIGRTDRNYTFSSTGWSSTVNAGMMANFSETWEFVGHDSGDAVKSFLYYDGTDDIYIGRNVGWGTARVIMPGYAYAPRFYDNDDANYYGDFAGQSRLNTLRTAGRVVIGGTFENNAYNSVSSTRLHFGGGNSDANGNYYIGTNKENYNGDYTKLDLRWHTGIRMGAQAVYGGTRIYNNEDLSTLLFSVGRRQTRSPFGGGNITEDTATVVESGNFYAANLIDRDNDNYYLNPASTSVLNDLYVGGYRINQPYNLQWYNTNTYAYSTSWSPRTQYYWIRVGRANTGGAKGILEYYAKDDVNYSGNVTGRIVFSSWNSNSISVDHHAMGPSNSATATVRIDNDRWLWMRMSGITWDSRVWWRWIRQDGISGHTGSFTKRLDGNDGPPPNSTNDIPVGYQFRGTQGSVSGGNPSATTQYFGNTNGYYADFYRHRDRDDTNYYTEPRATSVMSRINMYGSMNHYNGNRAYFYTASNNNLRGFIYATDTNDEHLIIGTSNGEDIKFCDGNENGDDWNMIIRGNGDVLTRRYSDATRHRDRDDTNYYSDPASTSVFNALTVGSVTASGNISAANFKVLTGQSYTVSDPTSNGNNATGRASKVGSGLAIYTGYNSGSNRPHTYDITAQFMAPGRGFEISADWVSATGTPLKVRSLRDCCQGWSPWVDIATSTRAFANTSRLDAPTFRDYDDTNYYGNFAGTSVMNTLDLRGEVYLDGWFRNDTSGRGLYNTATAMHWYSDANNRWRLYSTQSSAKILFTTNSNSARGYIEANDSNDIGFKDQNDAWQLRARGGSIEVYGNVNADRFYSRGQSTYYADPNDTSQFNTIATNGIYERASQRIFPFVGGGEYQTTSSTRTGRIQIKLPTARAGGSTMLHFTVHIYEYNTNRMTSFRIGGYAYSSRRWTRCSATQLSGGNSPDGRHTVRFYRDDGQNRHIVTIGETTDTWSYPQVVVTDVHTGYSGRDGNGWSDGWAVTIENTTPASLQQTITPGYYLNSTNYSLWPTNLDAYRFRDRDSTSYYTEPQDISYMHEIRLDDLIRHRGDDNTYLYFRAADDVQMVSGGRQMFRMDEGTDPDRLRFVTDSNWCDSNGDWNMSRDVSVDRNLFVDGYATADNFRDNQDTNYRANPASTSRLNVIQADDIQSSGDITAYVDYSDIRWKENVKRIENAVDKVQQLDGITFNYIDREGEYTGVIAQQVEKVLPGIVRDGKDMKTLKDRKSVRYGNMVGLLIEAIKEQQETINNQQKEVDNLKEMVKMLMSKLDK